jgi:hypothetical protein
LKLFKISPFIHTKKFQVRDEYRTDYDSGRGGFGKNAQPKSVQMFQGPAAPAVVAPPTGAA